MFQYFITRSLLKTPAKMKFILLLSTAIYTATVLAAPGAVCLSWLFTHNTPLFPISQLKQTLRSRSTAPSRPLLAVLMATIPWKLLALSVPAMWVFPTTPCSVERNYIRHIYISGVAMANFCGRDSLELADASTTDAAVIWRTLASHLPRAGERRSKFCF